MSEAAKMCSLYPRHGAREPAVYCVSAEIGIHHQLNDNETIHFLKHFHNFCLSVFAVAGQMCLGAEDTTKAIGAVDGDEHD